MPAKSMKIRIQKGKTIEEALTAAIDFFKDNESNFKYPKQGVTLYVTLHNGIGKVSPNEKEEFVISEEGSYNYIDNLKEIAKQNILNDMYAKIKLLLSEEYKIEEEIEQAKSRLDTAIKRNYKTREKWENVLKDKQIELQSFIKNNKPVIESILNAIETRSLTYMINISERESPYYYKKRTYTKEIGIAAVVHSNVGDFAFLQTNYYTKKFARVNENWRPNINQYIIYNN